MTEAAMPPATGVGEEKLADAQDRERLDTDPEREPNAPNRAPEPEFVREDTKDGPDLASSGDDDDDLHGADNHVG